MTQNFCCKKRYLPEELRDPYALWDSFPCPPPGRKDILFKVDWSRKLGPEQGLKIMFRIAKRCDVEIPDMYHHPGQLGSSWVLISCETDCYSAIVVFCVILLLLIGVVIFIILRKDKHIPKKEIYIKSKNGLLTEKQTQDQISITRDKKWVEIFIRKRKDKLTIGNEDKHSDDFYQERKTGIKTHSYHRFPCDLDPPRNRSLFSGCKNDFHIYEEIEDLQSMQIDRRLSNTIQHDNENDNLQPLIHPWDMQTFKSSSKSVISDIHEISDEESTTDKKKYHTYDRLHSAPTGYNDSHTGNYNSHTGCEISKYRTLGNRCPDKSFNSLNRNHIKQKHAVMARKDSTLSESENERRVCIDYVETPIIFCV